MNSYYKFGCLCMIKGCNKKAEYMISYRDLYDTKVPTHYFCLDHIKREHKHLQKFTHQFLEITNLRDIELGLAEGW